MGESIGTCCSFADAIEWAKAQPDDDNGMKERVINRMRYEAKKAEPQWPYFSKGKYGPKYDSFTCRNCGATLKAGTFPKYCQNCGTAVEWGPCPALVDAEMKKRGIPWDRPVKSAKEELEALMNEQESSD